MGEGGLGDFVMGDLVDIGEDTDRKVKPEE